MEKYLKQQSKKDLLLIGGGGHCKSCIDVIEQIGEYNIIGILDDDLEKLNSDVLGYKVIGITERIKEFSDRNLYAFVTVGQIKSSATRERFFNILKENNYKIPTIISNGSYVSKHSRIEEGTIIMNGAFVNAGAKIGKNSIINTKAIIEHDTVVGDNCHISTGTILNGDAMVEDCSFIGSNATVVEGVKIEKNSFIKAKSLVK